jgi:hypothetical protein
MKPTEIIRLTVSLGTRCLFATCSICSSIGVIKSSFGDLDRLLGAEYSDVSSQPESNLNTETLLE